MQLIDNEGTVYYSTLPEEAAYASTYPESLWYYYASQQLDESGFYWLSNLPPKPYAENPVDYISLVRFIDNPETNLTYCLMINVREETLRETFLPLINEYNNIYIVDTSGKIVSHSASSYVGRLFYDMELFNALFDNEDYATIYKSEEPYLFSKYVSPENNWIVVEEILMEQLLSPLITIRNSVILISFVVFLCSIIIAVYLSKRVAKPFNDVYIAMHKAEDGDFNVAFPKTGFAETRWISTSCENFVIRIVDLLNTAKKEERQKRITELRFRQMQINPHFMHNTLFTIKCMVDMNRNTEACMMLDAFNSMLKDTLHSNNLLVDVEQEIHTLQQYGYLLQQRYGSSFQIIYDIAPECNPLLILRFILQPVMENAIFHGLANQNFNGIVTVSITCNDHHIVLLITDNGCGMTPETLSCIWNKETETGEHIGLSNVSSRLKLHYNENATFDIDSERGVGTSVTITVPRYNIINETNI